MTPTYLGDGLYATYDGYHIELRLGSHTNEPVVLLDNETVHGLLRYLKLVFPEHPLLQTDKKD